MEELFSENLSDDYDDIEDDDDDEVIFKDENGVSWQKKRSASRIWWKIIPDTYGEFVFSFDLKTEFNLFAEYPWALTPEQKKIFDEDEPYWAKFFSDREYNGKVEK